jgi:predicted dehydrogenase
MRPFNPSIHPLGWRGFVEYGNGIVGDMCIHMLDMVRWMLGLGMPRRVSSSGGRLVLPKGRSNIADTQTATFDFGELQVAWTHRRWGAPVDPDVPWGATFYGERGTLRASVMHYEFAPIATAPGTPWRDASRKGVVRRDAVYELDRYPEDRSEERLEPWAAPALRAHVEDFLRCVGTRKRPVSDIEEGSRSTIACLLANVAMDLGRTLAWDDAAGQVRGDAEANARLRRPYRAPWRHPEVEPS